MHFPRFLHPPVGTWAPVYSLHSWMHVPLLLSWVCHLPSVLSPGFQTWIDLGLYTHFPCVLMVPCVLPSPFAPQSHCVLPTEPYVPALHTVMHFSPIHVWWGHTLSSHCHTGFCWNFPPSHLCIHVLPLVHIQNHPSQEGCLWFCVFLELLKRGQVWGAASGG